MRIWIGPAVFTALMGPVFFMSGIGQLAMAGLALVSGLTAMWWIHAQGRDRLRRIAAEAPPLADRASVLPEDAENAIRQVFAALAAERRALVSDLEQARTDLGETKGRLRLILKEEETLREEGRSRVEGLHRLSGRAKDASGALSSDLRELSGLLARIGQGVESQKFNLLQTGEAMERILANVQDVSHSVQGASRDAQASREKAQIGRTEVRAAVDSIETVAAESESLRQAMQLLEDHSRNIGSVMAVIKEVADQTNLLALNAAIEAARAGDAGRGFAVVADEVRALAVKTSNATDEIAEAAKDIRNAAEKSLRAVEMTARHTADSARRASHAGALMDEIVTGMDQAADALASIAQAAAEQAEGSASINGSLESVSKAAVDTAVNMQHITSRLVTISGYAEELDHFAQTLKTGDLAVTVPVRTVEWTSSLETGLDLIDSQHKMLCAYVNTLYRTANRDHTEQEILEIVRHLKEYTVSHFQTEEQYFLHSTYPDAEQHLKMHRAFERKVAEVERDLNRGTMEVKDDLLGFLKNWLIHHIQKMDHEFVPFVRSSATPQSRNPTHNGRFRTTTRS